jgi:outer membrane lipoprotein SlyB
MKTNFSPRTAAALSALAALAVSACATPYGPTNYGTYEQGALAMTETGTVVGARPVTFNEGNLQGGTAAGAIAGGAAGVALGGDTEGRILGGAIGAVAGALIGREVQRAAYTGQGVAYTVELDNGDLVTVAQGGSMAIPVGTRVFVEMGQNARVYPQTGGGAYRGY